jgi:hypothetical protein
MVRPTHIWRILALAISSRNFYRIGSEPFSFE